MKILILHDTFPPYYVGGAGVVAFSLAKKFHQKGHKVTVISSAPDGIEEYISDADGFRVYFLNCRYNRRWRGYLSIYNPLAVNKVSKIIEEFKPDILFAHNVHFYLSYYSLRLGRKNNAKVVLLAHDAMLFHYSKIENDKKISSFDQLREFGLWYNPFRNMAIRFYLKYVDQIVAVSEALKRALINNGIRKDIKVIHNGLEPADWVISPDLVEKFKTAHNLQGKKVIFFGGRLSGSKLGALPQSLPAVFDNVPNAVLIIAGDLNDAEKFINHFPDNIANRIKALGWLNYDQKRIAYASSDVIVFPSDHFETFGLIPLEGMAAGKPVIASDNGGQTEIIIDGITGYLFKRQDAGMLAKKITAVLKDEVLAKKLGFAGRQRLIDFFQLESFVGQYLDLFNDLLKIERRGQVPSKKVPDPLNKS